LLLHIFCCSLEGVAAEASIHALEEVATFTLVW
jgi:hypothetical protein